MEIPQVVDGMDVMAAIAIPPGAAEVKGQRIIIAYSEERAPAPYVVCHALKCSDEWIAGESEYDLTWPEAVEEFQRRITRDATRREWPQN